MIAMITVTDMFDESMMIVMPVEGMTDGSSAGACKNVPSRIVQVLLKCSLGLYCPGGWNRT